MNTAAAAPEFSDEAKALSSIVSEWQVENIQSLKEQAALLAIQQQMMTRQRRMDALCKAADKIIQSMARAGKATYTVEDLING